MDRGTTVDRTTTPAREWLRDRLDRDVEGGVRALLGSMTERLAVAAGTAATLRMLSADGEWLLPLTAHHPDPGLTAAMTATMDATAQRSRIGLWRPVVEERCPVRYRVESGHPPPETSPEQLRFLQRFPITAVVGVPVVYRDRLLGGAALVRFAADQAFGDAEEALLTDFARRVGILLGALDECAGSARDR
ncbi:GAF domain-containing protein [Pseudonocardia spirodelae]|uniref:GAF domain-containing protein n=1 Tax=Pseudonocardia spirodelae TaxID=3133431 RepID=A0ABU8T429_9PSEU